MSSPVKKASTGGIRKTTIKNNLYLKNRAALRERVFLSYGSLLLSSLPSPEAPTVSWITRVLCIQKLSWITDAKKLQGTAPLLPKQKPQRTPVPNIYRRLTIHTKKTANTRSLFLYHLCFRSLLFARRRISSASGMFMPCDPERCRYAHRGVGPGDEADQHDQCEVSRGIAAEEVE